MARKITMVLVIVLAAFVQCGLFQLFTIASVKPNLLLVITVSFALMRGRKSGLWTGFFCGLVLDLFFPGRLGVEALIYMWIGYVCGLGYRYFYDDDIKTPMMLVAGASLVYGTYHYIVSFLFRGRIHFFFYLGRIIIPEMLYTLIITIFTYRLWYRLNKRLDRTDKRSVDSLV